MKVFVSSVFIVVGVIPFGGELLLPRFIKVKRLVEINAAVVVVVVGEVAMVGNTEWAQAVLIFR